MIYDCPKCQMPQEAGRISCPRCQTEFDGPVPDDAVVPPEEEVPDVSNNPLAVQSDALAAQEDREEDTEASHSMTAAEEIEPASTEPLPEAAEAPPEEPQEIKPPPIRAESQPYLTAPTYAPPPYVPPLTASPAPTRNSSVSLSRVLLIALPLVLLLVLVGLFYAHSLDSDNGSNEAAPSSPSVASAPLPTATQTGAPVYLQSGLNATGDRSDPQIKMLIGRWEAKSSNYYVFNEDGTGSRGTIIGSQKSQPFLWNLVQKQLMLYGDTNAKLRFNPGPDADTIFLRDDTGHYIQYTRTKT